MYTCTYKRLTTESDLKGGNCCLYWVGQGVLQECVFVRALEETICTQEGIWEMVFWKPKQV